MNIEKFLNSLINYEKILSYNYDLESFKKFLHKLGDPHKKLNNVILIAGTKGKGSVVAILNSCLSSTGHKVGIFTSPHLAKVNERIRINGRMISNRQLSQKLQHIRPYLKTRLGIRTYFEVLTATAFLYFLEKKTDFTILEVGLGGRLDTTNTTDPILSVITRIGYDHTRLLGRTLQMIAHEKAGIIKKQTPVISIYQRSSVQRTLQKTARAKRAPLLVAETQHKITIKKKSLAGSILEVTGTLGNFQTSFPLVGPHQIENLSIALAILASLKKKGFSISKRSLVQGIRNTRLQGRFEVISKNPLMIFDCAHNQDSFRALHKNLKDLKIKDFFLIFGCSRDKDINYAIRYIFPMAREVLLVKVDNPRAMEPREISHRAKKYEKNITITSSVKQAIKYTRKKSKNRRYPIIITGSFYLWQKQWSH